MIERMIRAAKLDVNLFNEVEQDQTLTQEALTVVVLVAFVSGLGSFITGLMVGGGFGTAILGLIVGVILSVIGYFIWAFITYFIGVNVFKGTADYGEMLRTLGYAYTPNILGFFSFIPCAGMLIAFLGGIWALVAGVIAVREALDFDTTKAIITVIIGWIVMIILMAIVGGIVGAAGFGFAALTGR